MTPLSDPLAQKYAQHIQNLVNQLNKNSKKAIAENEKYLVSPEIAKERYSGRIGETFYLFPNEAPSKDVVDAYERVKPYFGTGCHAVSFEMYLSHRQMTVMFVDGDLVLRRNRNLFIDRLTEKSLHEGIQYAKDNYEIDWCNAKIFIFPYKSTYFFISDSFETTLAGGRSDLRNPHNWFSIPFIEDFIYKELKEICRTYEAKNELEDDYDSDAIFEQPEHIEASIDHGTHKELFVEISNTPSYQTTASPTSYSNIVIQNLPSSFIGIDFETLYPQRVSACSVGMVKYKDGQIVDRYYTLIRPPFDYPGKKGMALTWIHGFTVDMFDGERTMQEILPEMEAFAEGLPLVAHNCCVERACIEETARYYSIATSLDTNNIIDTLPLSRNTEKALGIFQDGPGLHSLNVVCHRFGVEELHHHNALDDAEMCGNLLLALKKVSTNADSFVASETTTTIKKHAKYNEEDKQQRTDLENVPDNPFKGCCIVLTGFPNATSQEYGHKLKEAGAKVCTGVSFKTQWLICGSNAGPSKMEKAKQVGAKIINEEEFLDLIN